MRVISKPIYSVSDLFNICIDGISNNRAYTDIKDELKYIHDTVMIDSKRYNIYANDVKLYIFQALNTLYRKSDKTNIKMLYRNQMSVKGKGGRKVYDKIMLLALLGRCPFCGIGRVSTLDHYLPKGKYPVFSILPYNLVPSCKDCNTGKGASVATTCGTQTLHPYYDDFTREQWLFAKVMKSHPISIKYFVNPPIDWDDISKARVEAHFNDYDLGRRFSIEASNELAKLNSSFSLFPLKKRQIKEQLNKGALIFKSMHLNSWESALYQALASNDWYCGGGYNV